MNYTRREEQECLKKVLKVKFKIDNQISIKGKNI